MQSAPRLFCLLAMVALCRCVSFAPIRPHVVTLQCVETTCAALGKNCGLVSELCEGVLDCGSCTVAGETCGGGGQENVCGAAMSSVGPTMQTCTPSSCDTLYPACGMLSDGCGGTLDCSACANNQICDATGQGTCALPVVSRVIRVGSTINEVRQGEGNVAMRIEGAGLKRVVNVSFGGAAIVTVPGSPFAPSSDGTHLDLSIPIQHGAPLGPMSLTLTSSTLTANVPNVSTVYSSDVAENCTVVSPIALSTSGNDSHLGTRHDPFRSLSRAMDIVNAGNNAAPDTVLIQGAFQPLPSDYAGAPGEPDLAHRFHRSVNIVGEAAGATAASIVGPCTIVSCTATEWAACPVSCTGTPPGLFFDGEVGSNFLVSFVNVERFDNGILHRGGSLSVVGSQSNDNYQSGILSDGTATTNDTHELRIQSVDVGGMVISGGGGGNDVGVTFTARLPGQQLRLQGSVLASNRVGLFVSGPATVQTETIPYMSNPLAVQINANEWVGAMLQLHAQATIDLSFVLFARNGDPNGGCPSTYRGANVLLNGSPSANVNLGGAFCLQRNAIGALCPFLNVLDARNSPAICDAVASHVLMKTTQFYGMTADNVGFSQTGSNITSVASPGTLYPADCAQIASAPYPMPEVVDNGVMIRIATDNNRIDLSP